MSTLRTADDALLRHRPLEDACAIAVATLVVSLGVAFYTQATLLTGSAAGIALLLQYTTGLRFGVAFALVNLPFLWLSVARLGVKATLRTVVAVGLVSALSALTWRWVTIGPVEPLYAAVLGGALCGIGLLILFRHRTGLGGINILAIYLQERFRLRAGLFMLAVDTTIMAVALFLLPWDKVVLSMVGAAVTNVIIATNHRQDRYVGVS